MTRNRGLWLMVAIVVVSLVAVATVGAWALLLIPVVGFVAAMLAIGVGVVRAGGKR